MARDPCQIPQPKSHTEIELENMVSAILSFRLL